MLLEASFSLKHYPCATIQVQPLSIFKNTSRPRFREDAPIRGTSRLYAFNICASASKDRVRYQMHRTFLARWGLHLRVMLSSCDLLLVLDEQNRKLTSEVVEMHHTLLSALLFTIHLLMSSECQVTVFSMNESVQDRSLMAFPGFSLTPGKASSVLSQGDLLNPSRSISTASFPSVQTPESCTPHSFFSFRNDVSCICGLVSTRCLASAGLDSRRAQRNLC